VVLALAPRENEAAAECATNEGTNAGAATDSETAAADDDEEEEADTEGITDDDGANVAANAATNAAELRATTLPLSKCGASLSWSLPLPPVGDEVSETSADTGGVRRYACGDEGEDGEAARNDAASAMEAEADAAADGDTRGTVSERADAKADERFDVSSEGAAEDDKNGDESDVAADCAATASDAHGLASGIKSLGGASAAGATSSSSSSSQNRAPDAASAGCSTRAADGINKDPSDACAITAEPLHGAAAAFIRGPPSNDTLADVGADELAVTASSAPSSAAEGSASAADDEAADCSHSSYSGRSCQNSSSECR
jgi:hypothetical protein